MRTVSKNAKCTHGSVTLELIDAMELSDVLDYLFDWLHGASDPVQQDLIAFGHDPNAVQVVKSRLVAFSQLLVFGEADFDEQDDPHERDHRDVREQPW